MQPLFPTKTVLTKERGASCWRGGDCRSVELNYARRTIHLRRGLRLTLQINEGRSTSESICLQLRAHLDFLLVVGFVVPLGSTANSLFEVNLGPVSKKFMCLADIGASVRNITGLVGQHLDGGLLSGVLLDKIDEIFQRLKTSYLWRRSIALTTPSTMSSM